MKKLTSILALAGLIFVNGILSPGINVRHFQPQKGLTPKENTLERYLQQNEKKKQRLET